MIKSEMARCVARRYASRITMPVIATNASELYWVIYPGVSL